MGDPSPDLIKRLRDFASAQKDVPDPRLAAWTIPGTVSDARLALLATCLAQDLTIPGVARLLKELHELLGDSLLEPWRLRQEDLDKFCRIGWLDAWPHREDLPGWITAVGDFLRTYGDPSRWHDRWVQPRDFVRTMAMEIPWMGRKSTERVKGWRLARWLVRGEGSLAALWPESARALLVVPHPILSVPLEWFGQLPPGWESKAPRDRQAWTDSVIRAIDPNDPAAVWTALESILRRGKTDHLCVERMGSCDRCPLKPLCKT